MTHYTTIEQSKKLVELGLDPLTSDMYYSFTGEHIKDAKDEDFSVSVGLASAIRDKHFSYRYGYVIPCWSLGALLEIMPEQITYSYFEPFPLGFFKGSKEEYSKYGHYWIQYFCTEHGGAYIQTNGHTTIEAAYNMVCWLLENGYIKKGE